MRPRCGTRCPQRCRNNFSDDDRLYAHRNWYTGTSAFKWSRIPIFVTKKVNGGYTYRLPNRNGVLTEVCRKMFLNTIRISASVIETAFMKHRKGEIRDHRGEHGKNTYPEPVLQLVKDHINSYQTTISCYAKTTTAGKYLEIGLTAKEMYTDYKKWIQDQKPNQNVLRQTYERKIKELKCDFFYSRTNDSCPKCVKFQRLKDRSAIKAIDEKAHEDHLKNNSKIEIYKKEAKDLAIEESNVCAFTFSVQKSMLVPHVHDQKLYKKEKLEVFNFSIFNLSDDHVTTYCFNETVGIVGENEIASILYHYIQKKVVSGKNKFILFGPNFDNDLIRKTISSMLVKASLEYSLDITYRIFEVSHIEFDDDEKLYKMLKKDNRDIYCQNDWYDILRKDENTEVNEVTQDEINCFECLNEFFNWKIFVELRILFTELEYVRTKKNFSDEEKKITCFKDGVKIYDVQNMYINAYYSSALKLDSEKIDALEYFLQFIPEESRDFISNIISSQIDPLSV